ncbi:MAG: gliding motility-associated C-terminal domain-containing protein, partial [Bacteroidetes bacterium]
REELKEAITGCYYVAGVDSVGNESFPTNTTCIENCPEYVLPNVFTPNGDGRNDLFIPFPYRFVKGVNFSVFNRWGIEVFNTTNIDLLWDGTDQTNGKPLQDGVYFYTCEVEEVFLNGIKKRYLNGSIQLIRN